MKRFLLVLLFVILLTSYNEKTINEEMPLEEYNSRSDL